MFGSIAVRRGPLRDQQRARQGHRGAEALGSPTMNNSTTAHLAPNDRERAMKVIQEKAAAA